jgi:hypothetical protein
LSRVARSLEFVLDVADGQWTGIRKRKRLAREGTRDLSVPRRRFGEA